MVLLIHQNQADNYQEMNMHLRKMYSDARTDAVNKATYLRLHGNFISLHQNTSLLYTSENLLENSTYDLLKETSHLSLAIFSKFSNNCYKRLDEKAVKDFEAILKYLKPSNQLNLNKTLTMLQKNMIGFTEWFISTLLKPKKPSYDCAMLEIYRNLIIPIIRINSYESAKFHLLIMDTEVKYIRRKFPNINWKNIYILQCGSHMPREKNLVSQYFQKLYNIKYEGDQFVYSEDGSEDGCKNVFATHLIDQGLSLNFFQESLRMHRDLLGDDAELILKDMVLDLE